MEYLVHPVHLGPHQARIHHANPGQDAGNGGGRDSRDHSGSGTPGNITWTPGSVTRAMTVAAISSAAARRPDSPLIPGSSVRAAPMYHLPAIGVLQKSSADRPPPNAESASTKEPDFWRIGLVAHSRHGPYCRPRMPSCLQGGPVGGGGWAVGQEGLTGADRRACCPAPARICRACAASRSSAISRRSSANRPHLPPAASPPPASLPPPGSYQHSPPGSYRLARLPAVIYWPADG